MALVPMTLTQGQGQRSRSNLPPKCVKKQRTGHISEAISPTHFILGTKIQPNKGHLMTQVPMNLTFGQGHRSRSNVQKLAKIYKMGHILDAFSLTDFILGTKVQPNNGHSMTLVPMTLTEGQRLRSNFPPNG